MKGLLKACGKHRADLVAYSGAGTSYGLMGHTALHWAAAKVCITTTTHLPFFPNFITLPPSSPPPSPHILTSPKRQLVKTAPPYGGNRHLYLLHAYWTTSSRNGGISPAFHDAVGQVSSQLAVISRR